MLDYRLAAETLDQGLIFFLAIGLVDLLIMGPMLIGPLLVRNPIFGAEQTSRGRLSGLSFHYLFCFWFVSRR
jgi:hypothetical protein